MTNIFIDRNTIKFNPPEGALHVPGKGVAKQCKIVEVDSKWYKEVSIGSRIVDGELVNSMQISFEVLDYRPDDWLDAIYYEQPYNTFYTLPQSKFTYEYVNTILSCERCHKEFSHTSLECEDLEESWTNRKCPECGMWDCCDVEYEALSDEELEKLIYRL